MILYFYLSKSFFLKYFIIKYYFKVIKQIVLDSEKDYKKIFLYHIRESIFNNKGENYYIFSFILMFIIMQLTNYLLH